jgi:hypothetical protein
MPQSRSTDQSAASRRGNTSHLPRHPMRGQPRQNRYGDLNRIHSLDRRRVEFPAFIKATGWLRHRVSATRSEACADCPMRADLVGIYEPIIHLFSRSRSRERSATSFRSLVFSSSSCLSRRISAPGLPSAPRFRLNAFCASKNLLALTVFRFFEPRDNGAENFTSERSRSQGADQ